MPTKTAKKSKKKCDQLFSEIIRSDGSCEAWLFDDRQCSQQLHPAHIISRRFNSTRTDLRNGFCLCAAHHRYFHDFPRQFSRFITTTWAQDYYDELYAKSINLRKVDWEVRYSFLKYISDRIREKELTLKQAREYETE